MHGLLKIAEEILLFFSADARPDTDAPDAPAIRAVSRAALPSPPRPLSSLRRHAECYALLMVALLLTGCAGMLKQVAFIDSGSSCRNEPDKATRMQLDLVRQQLDTGKYHSALAHLDTVDPALPAGQLLRARALRAIDDPVEAAVSYRSLLNTCLRAYGHQGLGTIAAGRRDLGEALEHLQQARELAPVDAGIRNDYGFALLAAGRIAPALREFRTAVELQAEDPVAVRNLVLALFIARQPDEARDLARRHALSAADTDALAQRADRFKPITTAEVNTHAIR